MCVKMKDGNVCGMERVRKVLILCVPIPRICKEKGRNHAVGSSHRRMSVCYGLRVIRIKSKDPKVSFLCPFSDGNPVLNFNLHLDLRNGKSHHHQRIISKESIPLPFPWVQFEVALHCHARP